MCWASHRPTHRAASSRSGMQPAVQETGEPVRGLTQHAVPGGRLLVLVTTPSRLYCFAGPEPLKSLFAEYPADASGAPVPAATLSCRQDGCCAVGQAPSIEPGPRAEPEMHAAWLRSRCRVSTCAAMRSPWSAGAGCGLRPCCGAAAGASACGCADLVNFVEFPAEARSLGQLHVHAVPDSPGSLLFAWLSEAGIFHGRCAADSPCPGQRQQVHRSSNGDRVWQRGRQQAIRAVPSLPDLLCDDSAIPGHSRSWMAMNSSQYRSLPAGPVPRGERSLRAEPCLAGAGLPRDDAAVAHPARWFQIPGQHGACCQLHAGLHRVSCSCSSTKLACCKQRASTELQLRLEHRHSAAGSPALLLELCSALPRRQSQSVGMAVSRRGRHKAAPCARQCATAQEGGALAHAAHRWVGEPWSARAAPDHGMSAQRFTARITPSPS